MKTFITNSAKCTRCELFSVLRIRLCYTHCISAFRLSYSANENWFNVMLNLYSDQSNELNKLKKCCTNVSNSAIWHSMKVVLHSHYIRATSKQSQYVPNFISNFKRMLERWNAHFIIFLTISFSFTE